MSSTCKKKIKNYQFVISRIFDALIRFILNRIVFLHVANLVVRWLIHCSLFCSFCFKFIANAFNCTRDDKELFAAEASVKRDRSEKHECFFRVGSGLPTTKVSIKMVSRAGDVGAHSGMRRRRSATTKPWTSVTASFRRIM